MVVAVAGEVALDTEEEAAEDGVDLQVPEAAEVEEVTGALEDQTTGGEKRAECGQRVLRKYYFRFIIVILPPARLTTSLGVKSP